ncbi:MAG: PQQ-binding-like beta-propeller repeat protein [Planctomycetia bacterium]
MRGTLTTRWGLLLLACAAVGALAPRGVAADDVLRPARALEGRVTAAQHGEQALERLPWDPQLVRTHVNGGRPTAVAAAYLMSKDLLVLEDNGRLTCLSRRDLQPKWKWTLAGSLHRAPSEGADHYVFLVRLANGTYAVHALSRRTGVDTEGFPVRLPYAVSGGVAANGSNVYIASLGSVNDNKTLASLSLASGRPAWGWYTKGLISADPVFDNSGKLVISCTDDGQVLALSDGATAPDSPAWQVGGLGAVTATPAVTPEQLVVCGHDGLVRCMDIRSGDVLWMQSMGDAIKSDPWVLGSKVVEERSSGVEGAAPVKVETYKGLVFARNATHVCCYDLADGKPLFKDAAGGKPLVRQGKWVVTLDASRNAVLRDANDGYTIKARLPLGMFDLLPTNEADGAIYGVTADGYVVAATPR